MSTHRAEPLTQQLAASQVEAQAAATPISSSLSSPAWSWRDACYLLALVALVVAMAYRYTPHITGEVPGMWWDPLLNIWTMSWDTTTLLHAPLHLWQAPLLYPNQLTLSYSENLLGDALLFAPFFLISRNPVFAYNMVFYLSFLLCGVNMYILARHYTGRRYAAFIAALVYAFAPYRLSQIDHIHVIAGEWIPLAFLWLNLALERGRWLDWSLFALFYALQLLSSIYYGIFLSYTLLAYILIRYGAYVRMHLRTDRRTYLSELRARAIVPAVVFATTAGMLVVIMTPYLISLSHGIVRGMDQAEIYSAFVSDFRFTAPFNLLYGMPSVNGVALPNDSEHFLFPGFATLVLTLAGVFLTLRQRHTLGRAFAWTALVVLLFAFGPVLQFSTSNGAPLQLDPPAPPFTHPFPPAIPMPWFLAFFVLPGFRGVRVPARLIGVQLMFLGLFAAYTVAWLQERASTSAPRQWLVAGTVLPPLVRTIVMRVILLALPIVLLLEAVPAYLPVTTVPTEQNIPRVYQWLAVHGGAAPIVELPMSYMGTNISLKSEAWYDYYTIYHPHPLAEGWSGYRPQQTDDLAYWLLEFPAPASIAQLQRYHIRYVVVHRQLYPSSTSAPRLADMKANPNLRMVAQFGDDSVWQVNGT